MRKETTKVCKCGNTYLGLLPSLNKKYCADCHTEIDWYLAEGQKSPTTSQVGGQIETIKSNISKNDEIEMDNLPAEKPMDAKSTFLIPLLGVTNSQFVAFFDAFRTFHEADIPDDVCDTMLQFLPLADEDMYLVVEQYPKIVLALTNQPVEEQSETVSIESATDILETVTKLKNMFKRAAYASSKVEAADAPASMEPCPVNEQDAPQPVPVHRPAVGSTPVTITVREAAEEFRDMWGIIAPVLKRLGIVVPTKTRVEHVALAMSLLEKLMTGRPS